jgi:hypothetical protein
MHALVHMHVNIHSCEHTCMRVLACITHAHEVARAHTHTHTAIHQTARMACIHFPIQTKKLLVSYNKKKLQISYHMTFNSYMHTYTKRMSAQRHSTHTNTQTHMHHMRTVSVHARALQRRRVDGSIWVAKQVNLSAKMAGKGAMPSSERQAKLARFEREAVLHEVCCGAMYVCLYVCTCL